MTRCLSRNKRNQFLHWKINAQLFNALFNFLAFFRTSNPVLPCGQNPHPEQAAASGSDAPWPLNEIKGFYWQRHLFIALSCHVSKRCSPETAQLKEHTHNAQTKYFVLGIQGHWVIVPLFLFCIGQGFSRFELKFEPLCRFPHPAPL